MTDKFLGGLYPEWRRSRIDFLTDLLGGKEWFVGKTVLELACGGGETGRELLELGALVTFSDVRIEYVDALKLMGYDAEIIDQNAHWDLNRKFDLVIHWGVLYHLQNWKIDLECALNHTNFMCLEAQCSDYLDPTYSKDRDEGGFDQSLAGIGVRVSPYHVEAVLTELGATFTRYDDAKLNAGWHHYDWAPETHTDNRDQDGMRRFWMVKR